MKKVIVLVAGLLALLVAVPLLVAALIVASTPATAQAAACTTTSGGPWRAPFQQAYTLTSPFGPRTDPITGAPSLHSGQDLASLPGPGPVVAAAAGTVTLGWQPGGYGHYVTIEHGGGIATRYGHLAAVTPGLRTGSIVRMGQQLGVEGSTGHSTGEHLHFEVIIDGSPIDPVPFMLAHGASLNGTPVAASPRPSETGTTEPGGRQGGTGFELPAPGTARLNSLTTPPLPIPPNIKALYVTAAGRYHLPWTLLAGIGMEETGHGRTTATSPAGAQGLMQFMPATWATYGVDGDGDGTADIHNDADSVMSAANYLTAAGATTGPDGVRHAIYAYNHADWYVNDVLHYAAAYGGGIVTGAPSGCGAGGRDRDLGVGSRLGPRNGSR